MTMAISLSPKPTLCALNGNRVSPTLRFWHRTRVQTELTCRRNFSFRSCLDHRPTIIRSSQVEDRPVTRRLSPVLESALLAGGNGDLSTSEWQAVPDIWKSTAEKYGDRVAVVDSYHDPPSQLTYKQVLGTVGPPLNDTEIKIIDIDTGSTLPDGSKGIVKIRGPQVMKGYFKNPSATAEALDTEGWFNTGDIGWIVPKHSAGRSRECGGMLVLEGRAKDTIVLSTGENVEPSELEDAALRSILIQQIVVVGQDQRRLGALIVPNKDEIISVAKKQGILNGDINLSKEKMKSLVYNDLRTWISGCTFQIGPILIVDEPFTIDNGLMTPTMKIRRDRVAEKYKEQIADLYK